MSLLVDPEMSAVLFSYAYHHSLLFCLASNYSFTKDSQPFFPSIRQSIKKCLVLRVKTVLTKIFQCYPNVLISQMLE